MFTRRSVLNSAMAGALLAYGLPVDIFAANDPSGMPLGADERAFLGVIADTLLPRTATPSATEVGVVDFIDFMYQRGMQPPVRDAFRKGLQLLALEATRVIGTSLGQATAKQRFAYIDALDNEVFAVAPDVARKPLLDCFATVKRLAVIGYYTSQPGAQATLDVQLFPGTFHGAKVVEARTRTFYEDSFGVPTERPPGYLKAP